MNAIHVLNKGKTNAPEGKKGVAWVLFMKIHVQFCQIGLLWNEGSMCFK